MDTKEQFTKEISTLFETVKIQAVEYSNAFENFRLMVNEFQELNNQISAFKLEFSKDVQKRIEQYDKKMQEFVEYVSMEYNKLKKEYQLVKDINKLHSENTEIRDKLKRFLKDSEEKFNSIYKNVESQKKDINNIKEKALKDTEKLLNDLTKSFEDKISTTIDEKTEKIKEEIVFRQRKIEGLLQNNESELKALQREFTIKKNDFNEQIKELKDLVEKKDIASGKESNPIIDNIHFMIDELNSTIASLERDVSALSGLVDDKTTISSDSFQSNRNNPDFLIVDKKLKYFEEEISEQDKRVKTSYIIAFMSIVFALISILLTFV